MSNAPSTLDAQRVTGTADEPAAVYPTVARSVRQAMTSTCRVAGFWSAVLLPLAYVPMLVGGVAGSRPTLAAALLVAHAAALVAGHGHRND